MKSLFSSQEIIGFERTDLRNTTAKTYGNNLRTAYTSQPSVFNGICIIINYLNTSISTQVCYLWLRLAAHGGLSVKVPVLRHILFFADFRHLDSENVPSTAKPGSVTKKGKLGAIHTEVQTSLQLDNLDCQLIFFEGTSSIPEFAFKRNKVQKWAPSPSRSRLSTNWWGRGISSWISDKDLRFSLCASLAPVSWACQFFLPSRTHARSSNNFDFSVTKRSALCDWSRPTRLRQKERAELAGIGWETVTFRL